MITAKVEITLKSGVLDPQGKTSQHVLTNMGFDNISDIKQGKIIQITLDETDPNKAHEAVKKMCDSLLSNPVIENYNITLV